MTPWKTSGKKWVPAVKAETSRIDAAKISVISYEWFEKRFLRLKRWFGEGVPVTGELGVKAAPLS
jgi:hypothetical protein